MSRKSSSSSYSWERSFSPQILSRGRNYYQNGAVSQLTRNAKGYTAVVEGTEDYCVEVEMEGSTVEFMDCDCPYAEDGNNCKHMAAVLYAIEALNEDAAPMVQNSKSSKKSVSESTEALIARIPEAELRSFLNKLCQDDERIERQLVLRYAKTLDASHLKQLRREFEQICQEYSDRHGFIDWERAADYELAVEAFLSDNTAALDPFIILFRFFDLFGSFFGALPHHFLIQFFVFSFSLGAAFRALLLFFGFRRRRFFLLVCQLYHPSLYKDNSIIL